MLTVRTLPLADVELSDDVRSESFVQDISSKLFDFLSFCFSLDFRFSAFNLGPAPSFLFPLLLLFRCLLNDNRD